ncbi:MAG: hypothetical protein IT376_02260 [Polyangiaceae bacterium]|nr:hypothetical protein [Polyangiaceae bacterium]
MSQGKRAAHRKGGSTRGRRVARAARTLRAGTARPAKKPPAKRPPAKRPPAKKPPAKKPPAKKPPAKKPPAKKPPAKRAHAKRARGAEATLPPLDAASRVARSRPAALGGSQPVEPRVVVTPSGARLHVVPAGTSWRDVQPPAAQPPPPAPAAPASPFGAIRPVVERRTVRPHAGGSVGDAAQGRVARLLTTAAAIAPRGTAPREAFGRETWQKLDAAAERVGAALTSDHRRLLRAAMEGHDCLAVVPESFDAGVCAAIASLLLPQPVVVVGLSSALRRVEALATRRGLTFVALPERGEPPPDRIAALRRGAGGLVLAPLAAVGGRALSEVLAATGVGQVCVLGAERASALVDGWSPAYVTLAPWWAAIGRPPVLGFASPCAESARHDAAEALALRSPVVVVARATSEQLALDVTSASGDVRLRALGQLALRLRRPGVVVCGAVRDLPGVHAALASLGVPVHRLHPGMRPDERARELDSFHAPARRAWLVVPAPARTLLTPAGSLSALIARADVRAVVHFGAPSSLEQYVRDVAVAGRDGEPAASVWLHDARDLPATAARLEAERPRPSPVASLGRALAERALESRAASVESLALATGGSARGVEDAARLLEAAGIVSLQGGWVRPCGEPLAFSRAADALARALATQREHDARRLELLGAFASRRGCRSVALEELIGVGGVSPCGRCDACTEPTVRVHGADDAGGHRQAPPRAFAVTAPRPAAPQRPGAPLTAKLGDFGRLAASR